MKLNSISLVFAVALSATLPGGPARGVAAETFTPYTAETVPQTVVDLWKDVDPRQDTLETEIVKEWREDGVVCRYVIFKIGTFKGADARLAALYTFPEGLTRGPAFVWAHGGGQRAERERGAYFAKHGYATVDINWGGREIVEGIKPNTDWGRVDPSQGPQFYPKALRKNTKSNFSPDEHTLDSVVSPRNGNWFLLTYAGRRAITFLEQQPEVDPQKIGFTGYSMGGNITIYAAIDPRLRAVVPMVGGASMITREFPGLPASGRTRDFGDHVELFRRTMESQAYYPQIKIPVLMLSASDDFHATFDNIFTCLAELPHPDWRVSEKMHFNHNLSPEQWILLNLWFDQYLKGERVDLPKTPASQLGLKPAANAAVFTVAPDQPGQLEFVDIYYSYDPNPQARFWKQATAVHRKGGTWSATLTLHPNLPLFVFANCTYALGTERTTLSGKTSQFTLASTEQVHLPAAWKLENLAQLATSDEFLPTFVAGWGLSPSGGLTTYKFRDPGMKLPGHDRALRLQLEGVRERIALRFRIEKNKFLSGVKAPPETYSANLLANPGETEVIVSVADFLDAKNQAMADWNNIATLSLDLIQHGKPILLKGNSLLHSLEWTVTGPVE